MKRLIVDDRERVCRWAESRMSEPTSFGNAYGLGVEEDGELVAAVVYDQFYWPSVAAHIVSDGSRKWMTRALLCAMFDYPFNVLTCKRITAPIAERNLEAIAFVEHLGFALEGRLRKAMPDGSDRLLFGLLREDCKYVATTI